MYVLYIATWGTRWMDSAIERPLRDDPSSSHLPLNQLRIKSIPPKRFNVEHTFLGYHPEAAAFYYLYRGNNPYAHL